jgi:hypothetical protein
VEVDLLIVPKQESAYSIHMFEHCIGQRRVGFLARVDRRLLVYTYLLIFVRINRAT